MAVYAVGTIIPMGTAMKLKWDQSGEKLYETGVDHCVLYPMDKNGHYGAGVAWNGIISISENPSGAEETAFYADNIKYLALRSAEEFGITLECYMYPREWSECNGEVELADGVVIGQQRRKSFGLCYRTKKGNDTQGEDYGFKYHLIYGCSAATADRSYETMNESPDAITFSYDITTTPIDVSGKGPDGRPFRPVSIITIDSTQVNKDKLIQLEESLFGSATVVPHLPTPNELKAFFAAG